MNCLFWNIRGMGKPARVRQLKELLIQHQIDMVGVQETIKQDFTPRELDNLSSGGSFNWHWIASKGHSGGILMGVREDILQVENWEYGEFFVGATVRHRILNFRWDILTVYGPVNHEYSPQFLQELHLRCQGPGLACLLSLGGTLT